MALFAILTTGSASRADDALEVAGFAFAPPSAWERLPSSSAMRAAEFRVPNPGVGHDGIVIFYRFPPGAGGSAERNIERWRSQFKEPADALGATVEARESGERRLHYFRAAGTLMGRDGEMANYALHAALLDAPAGRAFVRFVAPAAVARANEAAFRALIERAWGG